MGVCWLSSSNNQHMVQQLLQSLKTGNTPPTLILTKEDDRRITEFPGSGWERWRFLFKCALKRALR